MDWGGISCALVCAIPIVAIICDTVKKVELWPFHEMRVFMLVRV